MAWFTLFKVQHFHPTRLRRARGDTSTHLCRDDVALTLFTVEALDMGDKVVITSAEPLTDDADVSGALAVINETLFKCKVFRFKADDRIEFIIPEASGLDPELVRRATGLLVDHQALPGRGMRLVVSPSEEGAQELEATLRRLTDLGLVAPVGDSAEETGCAWAFTERGVDVVRPMHRLRHPESVLTPRQLPDRESWTRFELMTLLSAHGWFMLPWQARQRAPPPFR